MHTDIDFQRIPWYIISKFGLMLLAVIKIYIIQSLKHRCNNAVVQMEQYNQ